ncbi:MAG: hypothetical protein NC206_05140 [Bacteroides sp.]|nr:hypothetical protein [Roseburia sp.]MCM1346450.1 hypothetical protein [Bacteroides sp.]
MCINKRRIVVNPDFKEYSHFISTLPDIFDTNGQTIYSKRNVVKRFRMDDNDTNLIVKRYKIPNFIQRFAYSFYRKSKAERAYRFAARFLEKGIDTPKPIAFIEIYQRGFFSSSFFVSTEDNRASCDVLLSPSFQDTEELTARLVDFIVSLHRKGVLHGDLNLSNILYRKETGGKYSFSLIDTNRSHFVDNPSNNQCLRNMMRMTHRFDVSARLVAAYARRRGWDEEKCVDYVRKKIEAFEHRNDLKHSFKKKHKK